MALVSGVRSTLNPNVPLYIPAAFRQVEDFSPEWYQLITSSVWFWDYWMSQHHEAEMLYGNKVDNYEQNVADLLPDEIDLGVDEELLIMESQFEEFIKSTGTQEIKLLPREVWIHCRLRGSSQVDGKGVGRKVIDRLKETYNTELAGKDFALEFVRRNDPYTKVEMNEVREQWARFFRPFMLN